MPSPDKYMIHLPSCNHRISGTWRVDMGNFVGAPGSREIIKFWTLVPNSRSYKLGLFRERIYQKKLKNYNFEFYAETRGMDQFDRIIRSKTCTSTTFSCQSNEQTNTVLLALKLDFEVQNVKINRMAQNKK